jgi:digeranylgeranylglycerophospholipid reductase
MLQAYPITGAGIAAAVASGELAGEAAARYVLDGAASAWVDYDAEIREQYASSLQRGIEHRQWLNQYWHTERAREDTLHRKGWIAFPEYFKDSAEEEHEYSVR